MNLYEIDPQLLGCIVDTETGEVLDEEALNRIEVESKAENIACWIKNNRADIKAYGEEIARLKLEKDRTEKRNERLTDYLAYLLNGEKLKTARCSVSYRRSKSVKLIDESLIPEEYFKIERKLSKADVREDIERGSEVPGCELVETVSVQIR